MASTSEEAPRGTWKSPAQADWLMCVLQIAEQARRYHSFIEQVEVGRRLFVVNY
jgi:hypothetical protein